MAEHQIPRWEGEFRILALDGGGIKGLFSAAVMAKLEQKCSAIIVDHFDLITGTSTGGIIALGLGLGMRPREIVEFYVQQGPRIFGNFCRWRWLLQWVWRKFPQDRLMNALREPKAMSERILGESSKRLVIPAYNWTLAKFQINPNWTITCWGILFFSVTCSMAH